MFIDNNTNRMIVLGNLRPLTNNKIHQRNWIYSGNGIAPSQTATQYKDPIRVLVEVDDEEDRE